MSIKSILGFSSELLPIFKKDRIIEDARIVQTELISYTVPAYKNSYELFKSNKIASKTIKDLEKRYFDRTGSKNPAGMVADIYTKLDRVVHVVETVSMAAEKQFESSIVVSGITLYKVSLIKALETSGFVSRYALRLLNYLYVLETEAVKAETSYTNKQLNKGEIKELDTYFYAFCDALRAFSRAGDNFQKELDKLPDVIVSPDAEATLSNFSSVKLDPLDLFTVNGFVNPVYRIGMMVAEIQVTRYKEAKELKTALELRRMYLENQKNNGVEDEGMQREIDVIQNRIDRCAETIRKAEDKVGM